jgi:hypothetical protein
VERTPWSAADAPVGSCLQLYSRTRGSGADEGVRPTVIYVSDFGVTALVERLNRPCFLGGVFDAGAVDVAGAAGGTVWGIAIMRINSSLTPACFNPTNPVTLVSKFVRELRISCRINSSSNPALASVTTLSLVRG